MWHSSSLVGSFLEGPLKSNKRLLLFPLSLSKETEAQGYKCKFSLGIATICSKNAYEYIFKNSTEVFTAQSDYTYYKLAPFDQAKIIECIT